MPLPSTLSEIVLLLAGGGQVERAVEVYALTARHPLMLSIEFGPDMNSVAGLVNDSSAKDVT